MPGGDRTGPAGHGPMTGRGAGTCAGYPAPGFVNLGGRAGARGFGRGGGGGGWRHRHRYHAAGVPGWRHAWTTPPPYTAPNVPPFAPMMAKEQELEALRNQAKYFEQMLEDLRGRIGELDSPAEDSKAR